MSRARIVGRHLIAFGPRVWPAFAAAVLQVARKRCPENDVRLADAKRRLALAGAYFGQLASRLGREEASTAMSSRRGRTMRKAPKSRSASWNRPTPASSS